MYPTIGLLGVFAFVLWAFRYATKAKKPSQSAILENLDRTWVTAEELEERIDGDEFIFWDNKIFLQNVRKLVAKGFVETQRRSIRRSSKEYRLTIRGVTKKEKSRQ